MGTVFDEVLALLTPGHDLAQYGPDRWASRAPSLLLGGDAAAPGREVNPGIVHRVRRPAGCGVGWMA